VESSGRLGRHRYVVERSLAWLVGCRRLQVRYERRADILLGFVELACALICFKQGDRSKHLHAPPRLLPPLLGDDGCELDPR
jgi:hypothetical protein